MILLVGFYIDPSPDRTEEYIECLRRNAANLHIDQVHVFVETTDAPALLQNRFPALANPKVQLVSHGRRVTFSDFFDHAQIHLPGAGAIVANADIFFDETLEALAEVALAGKLLCLSRWEETADGPPWHLDRADSQDAWIFATPMTRLAGDFPLGMPGCDNRLAYEAEAAGLAVSNPSRTVRARHLHRSDVRRYTQKERLTGPVRMVPSSGLGGVKETWPQSCANPPLPRCFDSAVADTKSSEPMESALQPFLGTTLPHALRRELRRALTLRRASQPPPLDRPLATVAFQEPMGYTLARLEIGISTHHNDCRPLMSVPAELAGLWFTQVTANHAAPVQIEFRTAGRVFVLAAPGWEGYRRAAEFLDAVGWRETMGPLRTQCGTVFKPWSVAADAGQRVEFPTQVMLAAETLLRASPLSVTDGPSD